MEDKVKGVLPPSCAKPQTLNPINPKPHKSYKPHKPCESYNPHKTPTKTLCKPQSPKSPKHGPCAAEKAGEELGLAAIQGHVEVARFLLAAGADMNLGPSQVQVS